MAEILELLEGCKIVLGDYLEDRKAPEIYLVKEMLGLMIVELEDLWE